MSSEPVTKTMEIRGPEVMSLEGRSVVVTGAAQGIGKAIALQAGALGASVIGVDLNGDALKAWIREAGDRFHAITGDVTDSAFAHEMAAEAENKFGPVHGLVNNAGITRPAMIQKMTQEQWSKVIDVNLTGVFNCLQAVGGRIVESAKAGGSPGAIVNVSADAGRRGTIGQINYAASKSGVLGITMAAAREWAKYNIRVNSVCFGIVETPMTETLLSDKFRDRYVAQIPFGRWTHPEELAPAVCFLMTPAASYITGQHLSIDGGYHIGF